MKRVIACFLVLALALSLQGCSIYWGNFDFMGIREKNKMLNNQMGLGNTWRSEDGKIQFTMQLVSTKVVHSDGKEFWAQGVHGIGTMETENGSINIRVDTAWGYDSNKSGYGEFIIKLASEDEYGPKITLESGLRGPLEDGKITVTFTTTTYLEENTVITFCRVDE